MTNKSYVYRAYPKFTTVSLPDGASSGQAVVGKFTITAMGASGSEVLFGTTAAGSGSMIFDTLASGQVAVADPTITLYDDATGTILDTAVFDVDVNNASVSFNSFAVALSIPAGTSKTVRVVGDLSAHNRPANNTIGRAADYFQLILQDEASVVAWVDGAGSDTVGDAVNVAGYIDNLPAYGPRMTGQ
jgi:hypothetical protein